MQMWKFSVFAALFIVPDWLDASFGTCYPTDVMIIERSSTITVCGRCQPGYQASQLCLDSFRNHSYKYVRGDQLRDLFPNYAVIFSNCFACHPGTYSSTSLGIRICKKCSYCMPGDIVSSSCSIRSNTVCLSNWTHTGIVWPTSISGTSHSTRKYGDLNIAPASLFEHSSMLIIIIPWAFILTMAFLFILAPSWCWGKRNFSGNKREEICETVNSRNDSSIWDNAEAADNVNDATIPLSMEVQNSDANYTEHTSWHSSVCDSADDQFQGITLQASKTFDYEGGTLEIEGSSISVKVPKRAINQGETKDIDVKVKLSRPNDWKSLRDSGYTTALPQIELSPSGSKFNRPVEVLMKSSAPYDIEDDITFEFTEGSINEKSDWLPAVKCNSRKEAKSMALAKSPHVAFFVGERVLFAYYLHFTGGRQKKTIQKQKWFQSSAFVKTNRITGERLAIKVVLYEGGKDERTLLYKQLEEFREVSVSAQPILVCREELDTVETVIHDIAETWVLRQGDSIQKIPISCSFDPKYIGCFPSVDYVLCNEGSGVTDFECIIDVMNGNEKDHELKVNIDRDFIQNYIFPKRQTPASSSGYYSDECSGHAKQYRIDDSQFRLSDPLHYIQSLFTQISEYMAGYHRPFARNLGIDEYAVERIVKENPADPTEACYQLLTGWLRSQPNIEDFKYQMLKKIEVAIRLTNPPFFIILPDLSHERVSVETDV